MAGQVDVIISKKAIAEINRAEKELNKLYKKILQVNSASAKGSGAGSVVGNNNATTQQLTQIKNLIRENNRLTATQTKVVKSTKATTTANKSAAKSFKLTAVAVNTLKTALASLGLASVGLVIVGLVKNTFNLTKQFESFRFTLSKTSDSLRSSIASFNFVNKLSKDLGISLVSTTNRFIKFASAARLSGLAMKDTQKIFGTMAKAGAVLSLKTDEMSGVFLALEQMLSKGKVTTEELRRQLGERLPGAFAIMAASLGVTLPKLDEMLKKGEVLSAEALPDFADAVEVAYGIETVKIVDTLEAAQGKLTTAWQNFVRKVEEGSGVLSTVYKGVLKGLTFYIKSWDAIVNNAIGKREHLRAKALESTTKAYKNEAEKQLDAEKEKGDKLADLKARKDAAVLAKRNSVNSEAAEEELRLATAALLKRNKELGDIEQKNAEKNFSRDLQNVLDQEDKIKKIKEKLADVDFGSSRSDYIKENSRIKNLQQDAKDAILELETLNGILDATRLLAEKSKGSGGDGDGDGGGGSKRLRNFKEIADLKDRIRMQELQAEVEHNKKLIAEGNLNANHRLRLAQDNANKLMDIEALRVKDVIAKLQRERDAKVKSAELSVEKNPENAVAAAKYIADVKEEYIDKVVLAEGESDKKIRAIQEGHNKFVESEAKRSVQESIKLAKEKHDAKRQEIEKTYQDEIKSANKIKDIGKRNEAITEADKKMEKALTDVKREESHERIDILIAEQEVILGTLQINTELYKLTKAHIEFLKSQKTGGKGSKGDQEGLTREEQFELDLEYAQKFADALGDITNGIFDSKIAKIDAELQAEEDKYARLFELAGEDDEQKRLLAIQQEEDREKLEKKKRKLQKKQAKFNKAQALVDIAINTAIAASTTLAQTGAVFGIPLLPVIYSLGALQAAAVLAQPIPAFAEGGVMDHTGTALVGDGGQREVIRTPDGKLAVTPDSNTLVNLPKGSEIFPSIQDFNDKAPRSLEDRLHSATLLASISLNQKNINSSLSSQKILNQKLLDEMIKNTQAVKDSKSNTFIKTQKVDILHEIWKNNYIG